MENLTSEQQEPLRKASNERLRVMAGRLGSVDEEQVMSMDRPTLLQLVAKGMVAKADAERASTASATARSLPREMVQPREIELQLEMKRAELELRRMEAEDKRAERQAEERRAEREFRLRQMEMEEKEKERQDIKDQMEFDLRVKELEMQGDLCKLCVPISCRKPILQLAHCTVGCHQAFKRTRDRIRLSFSWPTLSSDTKKFCSQCEICQKTARVTVWDRTPIMAVPRAQYALQEFYADCAGPLFPNQKLQHTITLLYCVILLHHFHLRTHCAV